MVLKKTRELSSPEGETPAQGILPPARESVSARRGGKIRLSQRKSVCPKIDDIMGDYSEQIGSVFS